MTRDKISLLGSFLIAFAWQPLTAGTVLTFDHNPLINFERIDQNYGDRVTNSPDAFGHRYGIVDDGFGTTPNVEIEYGGALPSLWTAGYGSLVNVLFNDQDGDSALSIRLNADPGYEVGLFGFELASFSNAGQSIPGFEIRDLADDSLLLSQGATFVTGSASDDYAFAGGLFASAIGIHIDLTGLGTTSDNIAIDNVYFAQVALNPIPLPAALWLFVTAIAGILGLSRRAQANRGRRSASAPEIRPEAAVKRGAALA